MVEYSPRIDWQINNTVTHELVKKKINMNKIRVSTTKGVVEISGELSFENRDVEEMEVMDVFNRMKIIDRVIRAVAYVRDLQWRLNNWTKVGVRWVPKK